LDRKQTLLQRLDDIGRSLAASGHGLALLGLGSVGVELERIDEYSDLDFFAIVRPGAKEEFLRDLTWLDRVYPIAYQFRNTADGYKVLFADGIYAEFAVFEPHELADIPFSEGRIVWKAEGVEEDIRTPRRSPAQSEPPDPAWLLGEALTCLYVGLTRFKRGELLSAQRLIQQFAVDRAMELASQAQPGLADGDPFAYERRFERSYPELAAELPGIIQGYQRSRESARAILGFLERRFPVDPAIKARILELCEG